MAGNDSQETYLPFTGWWYFFHICRRVDRRRADCFMRALYSLKLSLALPKYGSCTSQGARSWARQPFFFVKHNFQDDVCETGSPNPLGHPITLCQNLETTPYHGRPLPWLHMSPPNSTYLHLSSPIQYIWVRCWNHGGSGLAGLYLTSISGSPTAINSQETIRVATQTDAALLGDSEKARPVTGVGSGGHRRECNEQNGARHGPSNRPRSLEEPPKRNKTPKGVVEHAEGEGDMTRTLTRIIAIQRD